MTTGGAIFCLVFSATAGDLDDFSAKGLVSRVYDAGTATPVLEVRSARMFIDHERRGFFRIGLLPVLVAEDVQVRVSSAGELTNILSALHPWNIHPATAHRLEIRRFQLEIDDAKTLQVQAALARPGLTGGWELSSVTVHDGKQPNVSIDRAELQVSGPTAGRLKWMTNGVPQQLSLFSPSKSLSKL